MGLMDFLKKGEEKPVENKPQTGQGAGFFGQNAAPATPQPAAANNQVYTVKSGDSLSKIAKHFYGDAKEWPRIHQANAEQVKDPNLIHPGQQLVIPQ